MNIINTIKSANFSDLHQITQNAKPTLSFWAQRGVKVTGYDNEAPIDALAARVIALVHEKKFEYTPEEREMGKEIVNAISRIYQESAQQIEESNCLTRLFWNIYSYFNWIEGPRYVTSDVRWSWENFPRIVTSHPPLVDAYSGYNRAFDCYTPQQYKEQLGKDPEERGIYNLFGKLLVPEF